MIFDHAKATQLTHAVKYRLQDAGIALGDEACLDLALAVLKAAEVSIATPAEMESAREDHRLWKAREKLLADSWRAAGRRNSLCAGTTQAGNRCQIIHTRNANGRPFCRLHWEQAASDEVGEPAR